MSYKQCVQMKKRRGVIEMESVTITNFERIRNKQARDFFCVITT